MNEIELAQLMFRAACPKNEIIIDDGGRPSVMVFIPKFRMNQVITNGSDRVHPAFIVNGKERDGFYISKYANCASGGVGCSEPMAVPYNEIDIVKARRMCEDKGPGWHLTTAQEWGAIALWCKRSGHLPRGNNDWGKDRRESVFSAAPAEWGDKGAKRVLTGSGPLSWSHDGTAAGVWDLNGNLSEWVAGLRFVYGELQVLPDNDGADRRVSQETNSDAWRAIDAATGAYVAPDGRGTTPGTVKADYRAEPFDVANWGSHWTFTADEPVRSERLCRCDMSFITFDDSVSPAARELVYAYGLAFNEPYFDSMEQYAYLINGIPEAYMYRGGYWGSGAFAGVFCWSASWGKGHVYEGNGFRASYVPPEA